MNRPPGPAWAVISPLAARARRRASASPRPAPAESSGGTASHAWLEDALELERADAGAVVADGDDGRSARCVRPSRPTVGARVPAGVLDQWGDDALDDVAVGGDAHVGARRLDVAGRSLAGCSSFVSPRSRGRLLLAHRRSRVRAALRPARRSHEGVDRSRHLLCAPADRRERLAMLGRCALARERELDLGVDARERCAQLVRHLGGEALLPLRRLVAEAREQSVERGGEARELVVAARRARSGDRGRARSSRWRPASSRPRVRSERRRIERDASRTSPNSRARARSSRAASRARRLVVGPQPDAGDEGADARAVATTGMAYRRVSCASTVARRAAREPGRRLVEGVRGGRRGLDATARVEDPDLPVDRVVVGRLDGTDSRPSVTAASRARPLHARARGS